jgi:hypothetical protein
MELKYHNQPTEYAGRRYASKRESVHAQMLDAMRRAEDPRQRVIAVLPQYRMPLKVNDVLVCTYVCDFYVSFADGHREFHEVKGFKTKEYILKKKFVQALYGEKIIEF